jgi:hypothetical protein
MRRFMTLPIAGLFALALAGPAAAGANVANFSSSATIAQASWEAYDEATETYGYGYVSVTQEQGGSEAYAEYNEYSEQYVQCTGTETPDDPDDDTFGVVGTSVWGYGETTLSVSKNYSAATASGTIAVAREGFDECTGESTYEELPDLTFSFDLTATSATIRESGRGSFHLPGEFNDHYSYKSTYRLADGTFSGLDGVQSVWGQIGKVSWSEHTNG